MNKIAKKVGIFMVTAVAAAGMSFSLAACGDKTASVKEVYNVNPSSQGAARYATMPMGLVEANAQTITVYDDDTYCLSVTTTIITNLDAIKNGGNDQVINRGSTTLEYYGSYTSAEDSGIVTVTLGAPVRLTIANSGSLLTGGLPVGYFDTDNWTADDTTALTEWFTGKLANGEGEATAENILKKFSFESKEVLVAEDGTFDYIRCSYHNVILSAMGF